MKISYEVTSTWDKGEVELDTIDDLKAWMSTLRLVYFGIDYGVDVIFSLDEKDELHLEIYDDHRE